MAEGKSKFEYKHWITPVAESNDYPNKYNLQLIEDLDTLRKVLSQKTDSMGFDTETTGLNPETDFIVGYSFALDETSGYYVPINHVNFGLGIEALDLIYEKMCNTPIVYMFNMRFDTRMVEFHGFTDVINAIDNIDMTEEAKLKAKAEFMKKQFVKYDMSKVNTIDVQTVIFDIDTGNKYPALKKAERHFLGWAGDSFEDTVGDKGNFYNLTPQEAYKYAATDALGTLLLGRMLMDFLKSFKKSGQLDVSCLLPLTRFENELTLIDVDRLKEYSVELDAKIKACQKACWETAGEEFNLGSPKDNNRILTKLNIHTGVSTTRGMSTSKTAIAKCLDSLSKDDPARNLLKNIVDYSSLTKQKSSYVDNVIEMCNNGTKNHPNRIRFAYRNCEVPSR